MSPILLLRVFMILAFQIHIGMVDAYRYSSEYHLDQRSLVDGDIRMINTIPASWVMTSGDEDAELQTNLGASVQVHDVVHAMEYTSNLNRILQTAKTERSSLIRRSTMEDLNSNIKTTHQHVLRGGSTCAATRRLLPLTDASKSIDPSEAPRTIFHAPETSKLPNLSDLLNKVLQCIIIIPPDSSVSKDFLLSLTMLYLDRACAVNTPRHQDQQQPCPFCSPTTIHRLAFTALLVAASANDLSICYEDIESLFGISYHQCDTMMAWMMSALGDAGVFVTPDDLRAFALLWQKRFPSSSIV